ncbi:unnamed protein product [Peniophora sp. CBMAI 1063]|nr:unnamed protein product [Peniophora sp. CBMAI 1063]
MPPRSKITIPHTLRGRSSSSHGRGHSDLANRLRARQVNNESCNNITITPPGWDGSCSADDPCPNGACCGVSGFCGYGDTYCGDGCISNCDAVAECGPNAAPGNEECPLNVCCSKFGFCGSTEDFCGANCVGDHCGTPSIPSGVNSDVTTRVVGYYEGWASARACDAWFPLNIPSNGYTHLNYAFALIDPGTYAVVPMSSSDVAQYTQFTNLKQSNPNLKTYISVGGWSFNDPPTQTVFSDLAASKANSQAFANSLVKFMVTYGFDGADIDWEYPVACERGGVPADRDNMVNMFKIIRSTFDASGHTFGLTFTAPTSYWYLQHFDLLGLLSHADWVNLMAYDLHGVWDAKDIFIGNIVQAHTNLTEIKDAVTLFQRVGVPLDRIVLGLGYYGRSFQLSDPTCSKPGCSFAGPAPGGPCTASDGTLSFAEIQTILSTNPSEGSVTTTTPVYDKDAQVKYVVYDTNNWVSYDDAETLKAKVSWAKGAGFGGLMVWSVDQDDFNSTALSAILGQDATQVIPKATDINSKDGKTCMQPGCGQTCPSGYIQMSDTTDGKLADPKTGCKDNGNPVCCPVDQIPQNCLWRGTAPDCNGVCHVGEITLATDSWGTGKRCSSGHKVFCCESGLTDEQIKDATDCAWYGHQSKNCNDNVCPAGTFTKERDYYGDTNIFHACIMQEKQYCCKPPNGASTTNPFDVDDLFPNPPDDGDLTWDLQDDPIDEHAPGGGTGSSDNSFGFIAMDGPSSLLSSVDASTDWVVLGCTGSTNGIQSTTAFCSKAQSSSCDAVFEKGAANTIVKLPSGCGGPYARLHSLEVNDTASVPDSHVSRLPTANSVYTLQFDFDFSRLAETRDASDGAVLLRIDATTLPGYWEEIDTDDPDSPVKRRALEERWFGAFGDWLSRLNKVTKSTSADLLMQKSFSSVLYSASQNCASDDGTTTFSASLDITCFGSATAHVEYGFYLEGQIFPPQINQAYVYASNDGSATLGFEITGKAGIKYDTSKVKLIPSINWPGLSYPGIVTIGPELNLYGQLTGSLTLSGTFGTQATYTIPSTYVNMGITDGSQSGNRDIATETFQIPQTWNINPTADVNLDGSLQVDVIPEAALVFHLLPGTPVSVGASAYIDLDGSMILSFSADLTGVNAHVGTSADINTGVTAGNSLFNFGPYNLYHATWDIYDYHLDFGTSDPTRRRSLDVHLMLPNLTTPMPFTPKFSPLMHTYEKRGIFDGLLTCPEPSDQSTGEASCDADLADDDPADADDDDTSDEVFRKREFVTFDDLYMPDTLLDPDYDATEHHLEKRVKVIGCSAPVLSAPNYRNTRIDNSWYFADPSNPNSILITNAGANAPGAKYAREHVYEIQLLTQFMSDRIKPAQQQFDGGDFCQWVQKYVFKKVNFGNGNAYQLSSLLAETEPSGNDPMPALLTDANSAKQAFISGKRSFRNQGTLNKMDPGNALYLLRSAALSLKYMNEQDIRTKFIRVAQNVENLWIQFFADYNALSGGQASAYNVQTDYRDWLNNDILDGYGDRANEFMNNAATAVQTGINNAGGTLSTHAPKACSATAVTFDSTDLQVLMTIFPAGITWTYYRFSPSLGRAQEMAISTQLLNRLP